MDDGAAPVAGTTVAWFNPVSGIAGDMALGALLDAGADLGEVRATIGFLGVEGWALDVDDVRRSGLRATRARVTAPPDPHHDRRFADVRSLVEGATRLPARVARRSLAVFRALAEAEGGLHGTDPDEVVFHEVGALDAIVDVVGTCAALESLGVDRVCSGPVALGHGSTRSAHGALPVPAPATLALLAAVGAPVTGGGAGVELTTPTGAALLAGLAADFGPPPTMTPRAAGYGAGSLDLPDGANVLQVVVGTAAMPPWTTGGERHLVELATNVDDATGETLAYAVSRLVALGANDAWIVPVVMKKGRPAHSVHVLCEPALADALAATLLEETGSLGVRATDVRRRAEPRRQLVVDVGGHPVRVKVTSHRSKAEHDDAAAAAAALELPLREVCARAEAEASRRRGPDA